MSVYSMTDMTGKLI